MTKFKDKIKSIILFVILASNLLFCWKLSFSQERSKIEKNNRNITIGLWNAFFINDNEFKNKKTIDIDLIKTYLDNSKIDLFVLLAVQWDNLDKNGRLRNNDLDKILKSWNGSKKSWRYIILPSRDKFMFSTAILWKRPIKVVENPYRIPVSRELFSATSRLIWDREPWAVQVSTGKNLTDFIIVPLYHKAGFAKEHSLHRQKEAKEIINNIPKIKEIFRDKDILLLGRFFENPDEITGKIYKNAGFIDINKKNLIPHFFFNPYYEYTKGYAHLRAFYKYDQLYFSKSKFNVYGKKYLKSKNILPEYFNTYGSNYYLISFDMNVSQDDD